MEEDKKTEQKINAVNEYKNFLRNVYKNKDGKYKIVKSGNLAVCMDNGETYFFVFNSREEGKNVSPFIPVSDIGILESVLYILRQRIKRSRNATTENKYFKDLKEDGKAGNVGD